MSGILGAKENSGRPRFWWVPGTWVVQEDYSEMAVCVGGLLFVKLSLVELVNV